MVWCKTVYRNSNNKKVNRKSEKEIYLEINTIFINGSDVYGRIIQLRLV